MGKPTTCIVVTVALLTFAACKDGVRQVPQPADVSSDPAEVIDNLPARLDMDRKVDVVASVKSYSDMGWWDHYEDGGYAFYKISVLTILEPVQYAGDGLMISHDESPDDDSFWRNVDAVVRFRIAEELLHMAADETAMIGDNFIEIIDVKELSPALATDRATDR